MSERPGVSYGEAGNIIKWSLCANCHGVLKRDFHPTNPAPNDWMVLCFNGCDTTEVVSKRYVEKIKENQQLDTDQVKTNLRSHEMPLPGTHNATPSFREIAKLRKGITVTQTRTRKGQEYEVSYPKEVDYWVVDFNEAEIEARDAFVHAYKDWDLKPKELNIIVPFDDVDRFWDAWMRCYKGGNMIAKAGLNPSLAMSKGLDPENTIFFERLYSVPHGEWIVKHWEILNGGLWEDFNDGNPISRVFPVVNMGANKNPDSAEPIGPVIYSTSKGDRSRDYFLEPAGTLRIIIRELAPFLGYVTLHTTGKADIYNISGELAGMALRAQQAHIPLHQLPMKLVRRKESGRKPDGSASVHYNTHVILDPDFSQKMYRLQMAEAEKRFAQLDIVDVPALVAGPVENDENVDGVEDAYFEELPEDGDPVDWSELGRARTKEDYQWLCDKAGIDLEQATAIWKGLEKDYSKSYDNLLVAYANPLGLESEEK